MSGAENKAVFLSYAREDANAAGGIADALRAAGVEVWFDQSELSGGDAWDQKIRRQIKECALFVPIISANTNARLEGYFRLEWLLAVERSRLMAHEKAFLVPVVIDDTIQAAASVPEKFCEVQWTRMNEAESPPAVARPIIRPSSATIAAIVKCVWRRIVGGLISACPPTTASHGKTTAHPTGNRISKCATTRCAARPSFASATALPGSPWKAKETTPGRTSNV
jgi:hypothetical protein